MSVAGLTQAEKDILVRLSYTDFNNFAGADVNLSMEQMLKAMSTDDSDGSKRAFAKDLSADLDSWPGLKSLRLTRYENTSASGFVGYGFTDGVGMVVVYRGTEGAGDIPDVMADATGGATGMSGQLGEADIFFDHMSGECSGTKLVVGHSLGGGLATHVYLKHDGVQAYVVNSAFFENPTVLWAVAGAGGVVALAALAWWSEAQKAKLKSGDYHAISYEGDGLAKYFNPWTVEGQGATREWRNAQGGDWDRHNAPITYDYAHFKALGPGHAGGGPRGPISVDTAVLHQLEARMRAVIDYNSSIEKAIDNVGQSILLDALDLQRDGDVPKTLGRSLAVAQCPPGLAAIIIPLAEEIRGGLSYLSIEAEVHFDRHLSRSNGERIRAYVRAAADQCESCEQRIRQQVETLA